MGAMCGRCCGGSVQQEKLSQQGHFQQPQKFAEVKSSQEDRSRMAEAQANAAIAAQKRADAFEKSAGGRAARTAIAAAKSNPAPNRDEPGLKWTMG